MPVPPPAAPLRIVWMALIAGVLIYAGVAIVVVPGMEAPPEIGFPVAALFAMLGLGSATAALALNVRARGLAGAGRLQQYRAAAILPMALAESVAIYGLVLSFITRSLTLLMPFVVVSLALLFACAPREPAGQDAGPAPPVSPE